MKCQIGEAIEKIDKLISSSSKVDNNIKKQLAEVKIKLNSAIEIRMSRMQSKSPGSESKKSIHPSLSGKVILANSGIGKSYAKRIYNNIVDGDDLFRDAANFILEKYNQSKYKIDSVSNMRSIFELWGEYSNDINNVTEAKKRRDEVYRKYAELAKESSKNGFTVLSSSAREPLTSIADFAIVQNDAETIAKNRSSELRENKEEFSITKAKEKIEAFKTKVSGIKTINLVKGQYISEILEKGVATNGSESIDITKNDFRSEFKNKRPSAAKWADKEVAKFDIATQAISDGTNNSTAGFVKDFYGDKANTGTYTKDDVVYLSTNGNRTGRVIPVKNGVLQGAYKNIDKAIEAGAKFVADTSKHLASTGKYNVGEVELAEYLQSKGYIREDKTGYGLWSPSKAKEVVSDKTDDYIMNARQVKEYYGADYDEATGEYLTDMALASERKALAVHLINIREEAYRGLHAVVTNALNPRLVYDFDKIDRSLKKYGFSDEDISNLKKFQIEIGLDFYKENYFPLPAVMHKLSKEASAYSRTGKYKYADAILNSVDARKLLTKLTGTDFSKEDKNDNKQSEPGVVDNNKYESISKDDIEAAKDIMSNNKKECE